MPNHYGCERPDRGVIELDFWLTIQRGAIDRGYRGRPTVKATAGYPSLARNERAMRLKIELPTALFEQPSLSASIKVDHQRDQPVMIDISAISEALRAAVGMDVDVKVVEPEEA